MSKKIALFSMKTLAIFILLIVGNSLFAQREVCGFNTFYKQQLSNPLIAARITEARKNITQLQASIRYSTKKSNQETGSVADGSIYEIPVMVHIVHRGEQVGSVNNPSNETIEQMIAHLNNVFAGTNAPNGVPSPIRFTLAKRMMGCVVTNGINRIDASSNTKYVENGVYPDLIGLGISDKELKNMGRLPTRAYYNIWIVWKIYNPNSSLVTKGYADFPGAGETSDGTVIIGNVANNTALTLAHEMGHAFGLFHTFEGDDNNECPINFDCQKQGDEICDTDPHKTNYGCPKSSDVNPCTGNAWGDLPTNLMGYFNCRTKFTPNQVDRAIAAILAYRKGLIESNGGKALPDLSPPKFIPYQSTMISNTHNGINIKTVSLGGLSYQTSSYSTSVKMPYEDNTCGTGALLDVGTNTNLQISISGVSQVIKVWLDLNNNGNFETDEFIATNTNTAESGDINLNLTIPVSVLAKAVFNTPLRLRIGSENISNPNYSFDSQLKNGQMKDFSVTIENKNPALTIFTNLRANLLNNNLDLSWETAKEYKSKKFLVQLSKDSTIGFKTIHETDTKAVNGYSSSNLLYSFNKTFSSATQLLLTSLLAIIVFLLSQKRKQKMKLYCTSKINPKNNCDFFANYLFKLNPTPTKHSLLIATVIIVLLAGISCKKEKPIPKDEKYYVRIAMVDINNETHYSSVISFIKKPNQ